MHTAAVPLDLKMRAVLFYSHQVAQPTPSTRVMAGLGVALLAMACRRAARPFVRRSAAESGEGASVSAATSAGPTTTQAEEIPANAATAAAAARAAALRRKPTEERFDPTLEAGITEPLGYFDPAGFCPPNDKVKFRKLRISEMKHGRIAMLASIGLVAQHFIRFPSGIFDEVPNGVKAIMNPSGGFGCIALIWVVLLFEFVIFAQDPAKEVGDFGDPLKFGMNSREMRNRELNNGRFSMFATMGIIFAEIATGKDAVEQLGLSI